MHPVGLYFLISLLKHNGFDVCFFDCLQRPKTAHNKRYNVGDIDHREHPKPTLYGPVKRKYKLYGQSQETLEQYLSTIPKPDIICFGSGMTYWYPDYWKPYKLCWKSYQIFRALSVEYPRN